VTDIAAVLADATVRYSRVWEDAAVLREALRVGPGDDVLAICSAGDNALALLLDEPDSVTAVDLNPAQTALMHLKLAAFAHGTWEDLASVLGHPAGARSAAATYADLRPHLRPDAAAFWDARHALIEGGILGCGRLDRHFAEFAAALPAAWPPGLLDRLLAADLATQSALAPDALGPAGRALFAAFFGRGPLAARGRDEAQFKHVTEQDLVDVWMARFAGSLARHRLADNFHLRTFLGVPDPDPERGPAYLRPSNFDRLRALVPRVTVHLGGIDALLTRPGRFSKGVFSDLFEYLSEEATEALFDGFVRAFRPGSRLAWWNLLVPRGTPSIDGLRALPDLAADLHARDRVFFYGAFHVAEVA